MIESVLGSLQSRINSENFSSVVAYKTEVYAVTLTNTLFVYVYKASGSRWVKMRSFKVILNGCTTISIWNNNIRCVSDWDHRMAIYSLKGNLLRTFDTWDWGIGVGQLNCPQICADDKEGNVMITCRNLDTLLVMNDHRECSVVELQPPVSSPTCAVLFNNDLYVASSDRFERNTLQKYV